MFLAKESCTATRDWFRTDHFTLRRSNAKVRNLSRGDVERIIEDGIARKYPEEDQEERVTMAQLLSQPVAALRSTPVQDNVLGDM